MSTSNAGLTATKGCGGCGGSSSTTGGCSQPSASALTGAGWSFSRPRFFSGQLLTEDDLVQLSDYFAAKNRLHNRFLFGDGVVCGLEVTCDPCGGSKVSVAPGYALDSGGNDIVVPSTQTLDIVTMARDLKRKLTGADCPEVTETEARVYRLGVRYSEQPSAPVLPYTTDDPCASQTCEFSRIREGYGFELQPARQEHHRDFEQVFSHRLKELDLVSVLSELAGLEVTVKDLKAAMESMIPPPGAGAKSPLEASHLDEALKAVKEAPLPTDTIATKLDRLLRFASLVARYDQRGDPKVVSQFEQLRAIVLGDGRSGLVDEVAAPAELAKLSPSARADAERLVGIARQWCQPGLPKDAYQAYEPRALAGGKLLESSSVSGVERRIGMIKEQLRIASLDVGSDCLLAKTIDGIVFTTAQSTNGAHLADVVLQLKRAALRLVRDVLFSTLLPSCDQRCDDPVVLLACVTVKDDAVIEVRSLPRRFAAAPASLRYWSSDLFSPIVAVSQFDALADLVTSVSCQSMPEVPVDSFGKVLEAITHQPAKRAPAPPARPNPGPLPRSPSSAPPPVVPPPLPVTPPNPTPSSGALKPPGPLQGGRRE